MPDMNASLKTLKPFVIAVSMIASLSACAIQPPPPRGVVANDVGSTKSITPSSPDIQAQVTKYREQWATNKLSHYQFEAKVMCLCAPETTQWVRFEVKEGAAVSMIYVEAGTPIPTTNQNQFAKFSTIDKVFAILQDAMDRKAVDMKVQYDGTLGYPTEIAIDYVKELSDEEASYSIRAVKSL